MIPSSGLMEVTLTDSDRAANPSGNRDENNLQDPPGRHHRKRDSNQVRDDHSCEQSDTHRERPDEPGYLGKVFANYLSPCLDRREVHLTRTELLDLRDSLLLVEMHPDKNAGYIQLCVIRRDIPVPHGEQEVDDPGAGNLHVRSK